MAEKPQVSLWNLSDLRTPWCIFVVATLRIADHIASGKEEINELAAAAGCDAHALHRVLNHLVDSGVFQETARGHFALNEAARGLLDPSQRIGLDLDGIGGRIAHAWGTLLTYVRTGASGYQEVFGLPFFEDVAAHPEISASFDDLIGPVGHGMPNPVFDISGGWESVHTVADVGGGTGALLAELLKLRPHLQGILIDQPQTVARSSEIFRKAGVTARITTASQSFFDPLPRGADLYLLKSVLNDWPDREALSILSRCAEAAHPTGRVVVLSGVNPDGTRQGLIITNVLLGGKDRNLAEFKQLARKAGLEVVSAGQQASGYFVVECRPG
jgi:hypothetical protein